MIAAKFSFYSNEHKPIHVHGFYQGKESKAEIIIKDGAIIRIVYGNVAKMEPLKGRQLAAFKELVNKRSKDIVKKWIDFFVLKKPIKAERITRKLK